jgi:hypothetical protein
MLERLQLERRQFEAHAPFPNRLDVINVGAGRGGGMTGIYMM